MRTKLIAGNWKMNLEWDQAMTLLADLVHWHGEQDALTSEVAVFPPYPYLRHFHEFLKQHRSAIATGAQDCSEHDSGAYTGEVSAPMISSVGASYCIIGHSERRQYHREGSDVLLRKVHLAMDSGLIPVFCCGEQIEDRENGNQTFVIESQLESTVFGLSEEEFSKIVIAYEPVWAIGTGKTASPDEAQDMHEFIRGLVQGQYSESCAQQLRILYGGSMKAENAADILSRPDVDGGLIGGASLKLDQFTQIIQASA